MNTYEAIGTAVFLLILLGIIWANYFNNRTLWRWCYRCRVWVNEVGERRALPPVKGRISGACLCKRCEVEVRGV